MNDPVPLLFSFLLGVILFFVFGIAAGSAPGAEVPFGVLAVVSAVSGVVPSVVAIVHGAANR